jgi:hypothetical protein
MSKPRCDAPDALTHSRDSFHTFLAQHKPKRICWVCNSPHRDIIDAVLLTGGYQGRRATVPQLLTWLNAPPPHGVAIPEDRRVTRHMLEGHKHRGHCAETV